MEQVIEFIGKVLGAVFGNYNDRMLKRYWKIVREQINPLEDRMRGLTDEGILEYSQKLREQVRSGRKLDEILPEAFALCREAARRSRNMRHFDVQIIGGIVLHEGKIAEMATGEGKTLVATLAAYLNALTGRGVHVITVNDYLARRDAQWMGPIYRMLGVTVGVLNHDASFLYDPEYNPGPIGGLNCLRPVEKKEAYLADITYGTNNEFGFDYLRDNMKVRKEDQAQRGHYFGIVDEVDSILIDEARTPLIISGAATESKAEYYYKADQIARLLERGEPWDPKVEGTPEQKREKEKDFFIKEKEHLAVLCERGIEKAEKFLNIPDMYTGENSDWPHYIETALKAHYLYKRDRDYVIKDGEVIIVDEFTGRMMPGRRWSDGLHEAIEVKEGVPLKKESQTLATITLQNYFRMYEKLAGMTGTAATEAAEFDKIYGLDVIVIPPNKPMRRTNYPDVVYGTEEEKFEAVADEIERIHKTGRPILVGTTSIEKSEYLSRLLKIRGIKHEVLNAKHHEREAQIIAKAGQKGAVTISTNMAGRGTDILLGEGVAELGGLHVIGTERHEARRVDNQLRGRAGRQGDPGSSQFFLSLEDDLFRKFAPPWFKGLMQKMGLTGGERIESRMVTRAIEKAQKNVENRNFDIRKNLLEYDQVMNEQRKFIYGMRQRLLEGESVRETIMEMIQHTFERGLQQVMPEESPDGFDAGAVTAWLRQRYGVDVPIAELQSRPPHQLRDFLWEKIQAAYEERERKIGPEKLRELERLVLLDVIDDKWKDHLYNMDQIRETIGLRSYAQVDPKLEYKREATALFDLMYEGIEEDVSRLIFRVQAVRTERMAARWQPTELVHESMQTIGAGGVGAGSYDGEGQEEKLKPIVSGPRVGRNDPCPCRSGKKYKKCCGRAP